MTQKVTSNSIESVDASKLSGDHTNATDGRNLTNINDGIIESPNDPTPSSNPHGGLGTLWVNYTSGEMYNCINAATNSNYWKNVGGQSGDIFWQFSFQGTYGGYVLGGSSSYGGNGPNVAKYIFANSTQQGNHNSLYRDVNSSCDTVKDIGGGWAYTRGNHSFTVHAHPVATEQMQRFSFTTGVSSQDAGNLTGDPSNEAFRFSAGDAGFFAGGGHQPPTWISVTTNYIISKFAFSSNVSRQGWGSLQHSCAQAASCQEGENYGYCIGNMGVWGTDGATAAKAKKIQKVYLQSAATASYITDAQYYQLKGAGTSSTTHGYTHGGHWYNGSPGGITSQVSRFQFSTGNQMVQVGTLDKTRHDPTGQSSTTHGYSAGGVGGTITHGVDIDRYAYSSSVSSSDWGTLVSGHCYGSSTET
jgi:hypothetical protein